MSDECPLCDRPWDGSYCDHCHIFHTMGPQWAPILKEKTMKTLKEATDEEIQEEVRLRHEAWEKKEEARAKAAGMLLFKHVEALIALVPKHQFNRGDDPCSDKDPCNPDTGCVRCMLLDAQLVGYPKYEVERLVLRQIPLIP